MTIFNSHVSLPEGILSDNRDNYEPTSIMWRFPKMGLPQNWWFILENSIKMDDFGVPTFLGNLRVHTIYTYILLLYIMIILFNYQIFSYIPSPTTIN